jgi:hypothetical protein
LYISEFLYFTLTATIKWSILAMYLRIFPTMRMRTGVYIIGVVVSVWWLVTTMITIFQCTPVPKVYTPDLKGGSCLDKTKFFLGVSVPNIVEDIFILCLPTYEIWRLKVPRPQKLAICAVFLMGFLMVVVACVRLKSLTDLIQNQGDLTGKPESPCPLQQYADLPFSPQRP